MIDQFGLLIQSGKQSNESSSLAETYIALERTDVYDPKSLERSARKLLFDYDCQSIPRNENQEDFFRDCAE